MLLLIPGDYKNLVHVHKHEIVQHVPKDITDWGLLDCFKIRLKGMTKYS